MAMIDRGSKPLWISLLALLSIALMARSGYADAAPRWTDAQLVHFSTVIVRAQTTSVAVAADPENGAPYTYVTLDVAEVLKGPIHDRTIILKQLGGRSGSTRLQIAGQPAFVPGEDVIVFLEVRPRDRTLSATAQWQGKFTITGIDAQPAVAMRRDPGAPARGLFGGDSRVLGPWLERLRRDIATSAARPTGDIVVAPPEAAAALRVDRSGGVADAVQRDPGLAAPTIRVDTRAPGQPYLAGGGEPEVRRAAAFWTAAGVAALSSGGLQPPGCFISAAPDGRISIGVDTCGELNPNGGTVAVSGVWSRIGNAVDAQRPSRFLGAGVIVNHGRTASQLLGRSACFERLVTHEIGHALGFSDGPDGAGVMAPSLDYCDPAAAGSAAPPPLFVPLTAGVPSEGDTERVGCAGECGQIRAAAVGFPGATNLAYVLEGSTLTLTWDAAVTEGVVQSYLVRAGSVPDQADVANFFLPGTATSFSAVVGGNAVFYVRVTAFVQFGGPTAPSNEIAIVLGNAAPPPPPPGGLTTAVAGTTVTLGWMAPAGNQTVTSYLVQAGSQPGSSELANFSTGNTATTLSAAGVAFGTYYLRVRTVNGAGISTPSNEVRLDVVNSCVPPAAPSGLAVSVAGAAATLTWTPGPGASSYQLQVGSSPGRVDLADLNLGSAATSYFVSNVAAGSYFVRVRSNNACGQSAASNEVAIIIR